MLIPAGTFLLGFEADFLGRVGLQEIESQMTQDGEVLGGVTNADPALIFVKTHIERPMQRILDRPVAAHGAGEGGSVSLKAADLEAPLGGDLALALARAFDHPDRTELRPLVMGRQPGDFFGDPGAARLAPSMAFFGGFQVVVSAAGKAVGLCVLQETLRLPMQAALVALERQDIVGLSFTAGLGNLLLATHGIDGHDGARQLQGAQQLGNGRAFVALGIDLALAQHQPIFARPGTDHVDGFATLGAVMTAAQRLAVDGDNLGGKCLPQAARPVGETLRKLPRIEQGKDTSEGIMTGDAIGQLEKARQPGAFGFSEALKLDKVLRPAEQRADGDHQAVVEAMRLGALQPRIGDEGEVKTKAFSGGVLEHPELLSEVYKKVPFQFYLCNLDAIALEVGGDSIFATHSALTEFFHAGPLESKIMKTTVFATSTALLLASQAALHAADAPAKKPDVLVIIADQWSPRYVSWDNKEVRTPHLDRLAHEGMIFDACYTTSPVCMPARVSLLTGLYPHNGGHGLWGNGGAYFPEAENAPMFRDIQRAGMTTAQIGKTHWTAGPAWHEQFKNSGAYFKALGLDHVEDISGPPDSTKGRDAYSQHLQKLGLLQSVADDLRGRYVKGEFEPRASVVKPEEYHDSFTTGLAVDFIGTQPKDKPLCLVVSLHSPHPPLDAPGSYATMFDAEKLTLPANVPEKYLREGHALDHAGTRRMLANYLGKMALVDDCVERLAAAMKARGTWDNTLVIFTSDHGEMMGAHGYLTKGRFYEESVRVPLFIRWPGHVKTGRSMAPVQMMDVYPTIVEAVGGDLTAGRFAKSLLPIAKGDADHVRPIAVSEIGDKAPLRVMARDDRFKYWADESREFLFDLESDPLELDDLAGKPEHRETLSAMREKLLTHLRSTQVNFAAGQKPKVQRLREAEAKKKKP